MASVARSWFVVGLVAVGLAASLQASADARPRPRPRPTPTQPPTTTTVGLPRYDADEGVLVVPYAGPQPAYARGVLVAPPRVTFDFDAVLSAPPTTAAVPRHPVWVSWSSAVRNGRARVTLTFKRATAVSVQLDPERHALLLVPAVAPVPAPKPTPAAPTATSKPTPAPTATPEPAVVVPIPQPPSASPAALASPTAAPTSPPTPRPTPTMAPTPTPTAPPGKAPALRAGALLPFYTYDEQRPGLANFHADAVTALGVRAGLGLPWAPWEGLVELQNLGLWDTGSHARTEQALSLAAWRQWPLGPVDAHVGGGYLVRVQHDLAAAARVANGPQALGGLRLPVVDASGWAVRLDGAVVPALFSAGSGLPWIWSYGLELALDVPLGPCSLSAGYRRLSSAGDGYGEVLQGPFIGLSGPIGS